MYLKSFGKPFGAVFRKSSPITGKYFLNSGSSTIASSIKIKSDRSVDHYSDLTILSV